MELPDFTQLNTPTPPSKMVSVPFFFPVMALPCNYFFDYFGVALNDFPKAATGPQSIDIAAV